MRGWKATGLLLGLALAGWSAHGPQRALAAANDNLGPPAQDPPARRQGGQGGGQNGGQNRGQNGGQRDGPGRGPLAVVGRAIFFDTNLSNPVGMSCASCHSPEAGFSYPNSYINETYGTVPGVISNRFGSRKPMSLSYAWFVPRGEPFFSRRRDAWEGGFFSDGRARDLADQAGMPMTNPNEMDNVAHGLANPDRVVQQVSNGSYTSLFKQAFGDASLTKPSDQVFVMIRQALSTYERSREVSPFSSKYDAYVAGEAQLSAAEMKGLQLFTGSTTGRPGGAPFYKSAECVTCHTVADSSDGRRDFFTNWTYANIGVPRNPRNRFYRETNSSINPLGYNPDGIHFVDLGLGATLYPERHLPPGNIGPGSDGLGDYLHANGEFRVASLRNVDKRPYTDFVKCYMHNGYFRSLKQVVHFYNTRNLTQSGEVIDLAAEHQPVKVNSKPLWPPPEYASATTLQNPSGKPASAITRIGNLGLTNEEENDIVAFLGTLSDGYFTPQRRRPPPD